MDDHKEKRNAIENCLAHDLQHARARKMLAILDGKLKEDEIIDPDQLPQAPQGLRAVDADRFMCPKCGGRMSFAPDGQSLVCDYCTRHQAVGFSRAPANEKDFVTAMATARGHGKPLDQQVLHCEGCGSEFILPPKQISANCLYCGSPHVVNWEDTKGLLAPDAILPHQFSKRQADKMLVNWVEGNNIQPEKRVEMPRGLYLRPDLGQEPRSRDSTCPVRAAQPRPCHGRAPRLPRARGRGQSKRRGRRGLSS